MNMNANAMPKEVLETQKAALDAMMAMQGSVFTGFEKLVDLNLKVMKATMDEVSQQTQQAMGVKDAQEAVAMSSAMVQPNAEKAAAYSKHVYDIMSGVQADLAKLTEGKMAESQKQMAALVEQFSSNAPAGAEGTVAMLKSTLAQANATFDSMTKAAKQAAEVAQKNLQTASATAFKAASDVSNSAKAAGRRRSA
jgi:phasin family protein